MQKDLDIMKTKIKTIICYRETNHSPEDRDFSELEKALDEGWKIIGNNGYEFILSMEYNITK